MGRLSTTQKKPVGLMNVLIDNSSQPYDLVLDPFMGIGSTGVACRNTNRNFYRFELDEEYFNIAKDRLEDRKQMRSNIFRYRWSFKHNCR